MMRLIYWFNLLVIVAWERLSRSQTTFNNEFKKSPLRCWLCACTPKCYTSRNVPCSEVSAHRCVLERGARGVLKNRITIETRNSYTPLNPLSLTHRLSHRGDFIKTRSKTPRLPNAVGQVFGNGTRWRYFFITCFFFSVPLFAQNVTVSASVDSQSVSIGDWIQYSVNVKYPSSTPIGFPIFKDTIGVFEIVQQDSLLKTELNGEIELKKKFIIAKYDAGNYSVQPFVVQYKDASGKIHSALSNPIPIEIRGVEVDTSLSIKDVKPQLSVPISAEEIALYAGIVLALAGIGYGIYYYVQQKKKKAGLIVEVKPTIPPHVLALIQLEELEAKRLWQSGEIKAFYSEATEIVRRYFELRYGIMALEMTSGEVMNQLKKFKLEKNITPSIEQFLSDADLVKFAKYQPIASENEQVIGQARSIVEKTKPVEVVVTAKEVAASK